MLILLIDMADLQLLIQSESFSIINKIEDAQAQLEKPKFARSLNAPPPKYKQVDKTIVSLRLAYVIDHSFEMSF